MSVDHTSPPSYSEEVQRLGEIDRQSEVATIQSLMAQPGGRRFLWNLMSFCSVFSGAENLDHGWLAYNEGRRNVGLKLLHSIHAHAPENYAHMEQESAAISAYLRSVKTQEEAQQRNEFE